MQVFFMSKRKNSTQAFQVRILRAYIEVRWHHNPLHYGPFSLIAHNKSMQADLEPSWIAVLSTLAVSLLERINSVPFSPVRYESSCSS